MTTLKKILAYIGTFGSNPNKVAQMAHALAGFAATSTLGTAGLIAINVWGIPKETGIDPKYENAPFFWDGAEDLAFYEIGAAVGMLYHYLVFRRVWY